MLLWKGSPVAQSDLDDNPAVCNQWQVLIKTCGNFAGTFVPVKLSPVFIIPPCLPYST